MALGEGPPEGEASKEEVRVEGWKATIFGDG